MITSAELLKSYKNYQATKNILEYTKQEAIRRGQINNKFLETINFPFIGDINVKKKQQDITSIFNNLLENINENAFLNIIAEFEKQVFIKIHNSSIKIKDVVNSNYQIEYPMFEFRAEFIKSSEDVFNLTGFNNFLDSHIELKKQLKEIILFRNYLAHGKRNDVGEPSNKTIEQSIKTLDNILKML
jgi:hypothetical protein